MKSSEPLGNLRKPYGCTEYTFGIISLAYLLKHSMPILYGGERENVNNKLKRVVVAHFTALCSQDLP
jgi:hypothetical protein